MDKNFEFIDTGLVIEKGGKYLSNHHNPLTWSDDIKEALVYDPLLLSKATDLTIVGHVQWDELKDANVIPIKRVTQYQLGEF
jgi:hypothetical protein